MCGAYACGIDYTSRDSGMGNMASTLAHEIGHNLNLMHDSQGNSCPSSGFVMASTGCSSCSNYPTQFSTCSRDQLSSWFSSSGANTAGNPTCLNNIPSLCGNGIVDPGEQCDSGNTFSGSSCCTGSCQLRANAQCDTSNGKCCDTSTCRFRPLGHECRAAGQGSPRDSACDLADTCSGTSARCPDIQRANGTVCTTASSGPG
ncbi:hypothetical protein BCR44DRAFT_132405, partial [Catenaria anguillulae PL171]